MIDRRNVIDKYKGWQQDLIIEDVNKQTFPYAVCMINWSQDYNFASLIRNANAFGANKVFYMSPTKRYDPRGAVGAKHVTIPTYLSTYSDLFKLKNDYTFVGVEQYPGAKPLHKFNWKKNSLMLFGSEGLGLEPEVLDMCDNLVYIPQHGSVRSINVSSCSAVVMHDFVRKYNSPLFNIKARMSSLWRTSRMFLQSFRN